MLHHSFPELRCTLNDDAGFLTRQMGVAGRERRAHQRVPLGPALCPICPFDPSLLAIAWVPSGKSHEETRIQLM